MMNNNKVITLCGSRKFSKQFKEVEIELARKGFTVLSPIFGDDLEITKEEALLFGKAHFRKIELADELFIIDVNRYIGESTLKEIDFAKSLGKNISYYSEQFI